MSTAPSASVSTRPYRPWMPEHVTRLVQLAAWIMLFAQSGIIVTGAVVRLTGSGLGCPTWPMCTDESLVNTPEMGMHGIIEFGNRLLGVALGVLGLLMLIMLWRMRRTRPDLFWITFGLTAIVPFQAVLGGITVHMELNPWIVAAHFMPSAIAVGVSAYLVRRTYDSGEPATRIGSVGLRRLAWLIAALSAIVVVLGVLTTGAGPHAGDEISARNGFDVLLMSRLHAAPVWLLIAATVLARVMAARQQLREVSRTLDVMLLVIIVQGAIGYIQFFAGLPIWVVAAHLLGVGLVIAASVAVVDAHYPRPPLAAGSAESRTPAEPTGASAGPAASR